MGDSDASVLMAASEEFRSNTERRLARVVENRAKDLITPTEFGCAVFEVIYHAALEAQDRHFPETDVFACLAVVPVERLKEVDEFAARVFRPADYALDFPLIGGPFVFGSEEEKLRIQKERRRRLIAIHEHVKSLLSGIA
jgi:hypothetical protein